MTDRPLTPDPLATLLDGLLIDWRNVHVGSLDTDDIAARLRAAGVTLTQPQPDAAVTHCGDPEPHEPHDDEGTASGRYLVTTCPGRPTPTASQPRPLPPRDFNPGGDGYPSWKDPMTGRDKNR